MEQSRREEEEIRDSDEADQQKRAKEKRKILKEKTITLLQELRDKGKIKEKKSRQVGISANLDEDDVFLKPKPKTDPANTLICEWCYVKCEEFNGLHKVLILTITVGIQILNTQLPETLKSGGHFE